ncbi:MAG: hypothetical protein JXA18_14910 [Chitinispirillaceae bacterium]|nr:hypothetical protein [Chitinispirillaceae bacterium]
MKVPTLISTAALISFLVIGGITAEKLSDISAPDSTTAASMSSKQEMKGDGAATLPIFTKKELARYNGAGGNAAYVGVDGIVYDVTPVRAWRKGKHKGRHVAGIELGDAIKKKSPHGLKVLKKLKVVGTLSPAAK